MGAWRYLHENFGKKLFSRFPFALGQPGGIGESGDRLRTAHTRSRNRIISCERAFGDAENEFQKYENREQTKGKV